MKISRILMFVAPILFAGLFLFPLWNITLEAPQYPTPLGMDIHINDFRDTNPHDIKNINLMNHYVGMKYIPDAIPEFKTFPIGIMISMVLGLLVAFKGDSKWYLAWFILMCVLSSAGLIDFYLWEHDYGHNLDPKAIMQFKNPDGSPMGFQPPIFGSKDILNFRAHSYPRLGAYFLAAGIGLSLVAFWLGKREAKKA
ncbi:MAG: hypothetical protein HRT73_04385 [Flavobacteriales bacterium]|nr:hypothetical protein [Flavobacteriales bacterium]